MLCDVVDLVIIFQCPVLPAQAAQAEYERVKQRNLQELGRWKVQKSANFAAMLVRFRAWQSPYYALCTGQQVAVQCNHAVVPCPCSKFIPGSAHFTSAVWQEEPM